MMRGRCARTSTSASGESATACMPPCCVPSTPASKPISTRKRFSGWQSSPTAFSKPRNSCSTGIWRSRKNSGTPLSPASATTSNPTKASGSQKMPFTHGSGSSSSRSATPSSQYATIWRCGLGRIHLSCTCPVMEFLAYIPLCERVIRDTSELCELILKKLQSQISN